MRRISVKEFENNVDFYLELSATEDIYVVKDDEEITVLTKPNDYCLGLIEKVKGSFGEVKQDIDYSQILEEGLFKKNKI